MPERTFEHQSFILHGIIQAAAAHPYFGECADMGFDIKVNFVPGVFIAEIHFAVFKHQPPAFLSRFKTMQFKLHHDALVVRHKTAINTASDKSIIAKAVTDTTTKAIELSGGFGYLRKSPLQRFFHDSFASQFHPLQEKKQQSFTGRLAMGLEPVEVPEFD